MNPHPTTSLPLRAWDNHRPLAVGLDVEDTTGARFRVTGFDAFSVRLAPLTRGAEVHLDPGGLFVPLLTERAAISALRLVSFSPSVLHGWIHPHLSLLPAEQIAEALVLAYEASAPIVGLLQFTADGRIVTLGDTGGRAQYRMTVEEVAIPKGKTVPGPLWRGRLLRRIGPYGADHPPFDILEGPSPEFLFHKAEDILGHMGYLFLGDDGHIRRARGIPVVEAELPF